MNDQTDSQLLGAYAGNRSEAAFAELVRRHIDFVYSAVVRMVCDRHLAEDVTQGVFVALATNASQLAERPALSGWLHRTARNIAAHTVRTIERRRAREQEASAMNELLSGGTDTAWEDISPHLDAALDDLNEADRDALLLRYFEGKSAHEMAKVLGVSEEAAQKRVSRAVEHLREFLAKRGVTVGASGLALLISTYGVLLAPMGLSATVTGVILAAVVTEAAATFGWLKSVAGILLAGFVAGLLVFSLNQRRVAQHKEAARVALAGQEQITFARDEALAAVTASQKQIEALRREVTELPQLRSELARLRNRIALSQARNDANAQPPLSAEELRALLSVDGMPYEVARTRSFQLYLARDTNALATIRARGTSLLPQLLELLGTENKAGEDLTTSITTTQADPFQDHGRFQRTLALQGFHALGPKAAAAIPALLRFKATTPDDDAAYALAGIAYAPVTPLVEALSSPDEAIRRRATLALGLMQAKEPAVNNGLIACLSNPEEHPELRLVALFALGRTGPEPEQVLPALQEALRDPKLTGLTNHVIFQKGDVIDGFCAAFERCGPLAKSAVPQILKLLPSLSNQEARVVKEVLKRVDYEAATAAGIP